MATVTYYFDGYDTGGEEWTFDPDYMVDNNLSNLSYTNTDGDVELLNSNTCPGTGGATITKVELRAYGRNSSFFGGDCNIRPVFSGGDGDNHLWGPTGSNAWSSYIDITSDTNAPGTWTWGDVQSLDCDMEVVLAFFQQVRCGKVEIRVTYTPDVTITPDVLALELTLETPTLFYDFTVFPATLALELNLETPNTKFDYTVNVSTLALELTLEEAAFVQNITLSLDELTLELDLLVPWVGTDTLEDIGLKMVDGDGTFAVAVSQAFILYKLRVYDSGTKYGVYLVDTGDANASKIRIYDGTTTKAIRKFT